MDAVKSILIGIGLFLLNKLLFTGVAMLVGIAGTLILMIPPLPDLMTMPMTMAYLLFSLCLSAMLAVYALRAILRKIGKTYTKLTFGALYTLCVGVQVMAVMASILVKAPVAEQLIVDTLTLLLLIILIQPEFLKKISKREEKESL